MHAHAHMRVYACFSLIHQRRMQQYDDTTVYSLYYLTSIGYTLAATRFSLAQCNTIHSPVIWATLNKMGINRNVYRNIVFGPKYVGGMALRHLHTLKGIRRTQYLIGHLTNDDGVATLMRICIEATQHHFSFSSITFTDRLSSTDLGYMTYGVSMTYTMVPSQSPIIGYHTLNVHPIKQSCPLLYYSQA
jgi:hypothetical protein